MNQPNSGCNPSGGRVVIHAVRGEWGKFEEWCVWVDQRLDTFACQQLAAFFMTFTKFFWATQLRLHDFFLELGDKTLHVGSISLKLRRVGTNFTFNAIHKCKI